MYGDDNEDVEQQKHQNIQIEMLLSLLEKLILMNQLTLMKFKKPNTHVRLLEELANTDVSLQEKLRVMLAWWRS